MAFFSVRSGWNSSRQSPDGACRFFFWFAVAPSGRDERAQIKDKRTLIVDDVISTGDSLKAVHALVEIIGGQIAASCAIFAEGDAANRSDIIFLEPLPLFFK